MKKKSIIIKSLVILVVFLLFVGLIASYFNWKNNYQNRVYPGISVGGLDLSKKSYEEVQSLLNIKIDTLTKQGVDFVYENKRTNIALNSNELSPDLNYQLINFNIDEALEKIFSYNKSNSFINYLMSQVRGKEQNKIIITYTIDEQKIISMLGEIYKELNIPPTNASFSVSEKQGLEISPEKVGKEINYELALTDIKNSLENLTKPEVNLKTHSKYPEVKSLDLKSIENDAKKIINQGGIKLVFIEDKTGTSSASWLIKANKLTSWISVDKKNDKLVLSLDKERLTEYLTLNAVPEIDVKAVRPRFEIKNGRVSTWEKGINGRKLNLEKSVEKISNEFLSGQKEISLIVEEQVSETISSEDTYNIKEIIGTGHSNFVGSPTNRRKNIEVGAKSVNGILLAPGEEFSLVKVLGDVSKESGYFPELVIKDNKTIPEYGGGLCQVATTIFRSALASGLPITARRNHSYRVSYYEPAGTDAAVYIPNPDIRFINDTANYILIQSRIVKNDIYFDFWGTKDGRIATTTKPVIYNITKPAPTKYIESSELAPGQKKCTEKPHNGADAYFDYKVIYPDKATTTPVKEKRFSSHYVPWQEVCLVGKSASPSSSISSSSPITNSSSTSTATTTP